MKGVWHTEDWFAFANAVGSIATAAGVIYAMLQGNAARKESNRLENLRVMEENKVKVKKLFSAAAGVGEIAYMGEVIASAEILGLTQFNITTILAEVLEERGEGIEGGKVTKLNSHLVAAEIKTRALAAFRSQRILPKD